MTTETSDYIYGSNRRARRNALAAETLDNTATTTHDSNMNVDGVTYRAKANLGKRAAAMLVAGATPENTRGTEAFNELWEPDEKTTQTIEDK